MKEDDAHATAGTVSESTRRIREDQKKGTGKITAIMVSHADQDHCPMCGQSLTEIAALRAEVERLKNRVDQVRYKDGQRKMNALAEEISAQKARADKAEAEVERLKDFIDRDSAAYQARAARLEAAIKAQEHGICASSDDAGNLTGKPCNCWKSRALEES